jgi:hypothetical protein
VPVFFTFIGDALMHIIILFSYNSCQLDRIDLGFVRRSQQESNSRETCTLKKCCDDMERQNVVAKMSEKNLITFYRDMNYS